MDARYYLGNFAMPHATVTENHEAWELYSAILMLDQCRLGFHADQALYKEATIRSQAGLAAHLHLDHPEIFIPREWRSIAARSAALRLSGMRDVWMHIIKSTPTVPAVAHIVDMAAMMVIDKDLELAFPNVGEVRNAIAHEEEHALEVERHAHGEIFISGSFNGDVYFLTRDPVRKAKDRNGKVFQLEMGDGALRIVDDLIGRMIDIFRPAADAAEEARRQT